jgi:hypothetical protein
MALFPAETRMQCGKSHRFGLWWGVWDCQKWQSLARGWRSDECFGVLATARCGVVAIAKKTGFWFFFSKDCFQTADEVTETMVVPRVQLSKGELPC